MGMGAYSRNHIDVSSFASNQACLAQINRVSSAVYAEKRFLMSELNEAKLVAALPTSCYLMNRALHS